MDEVTSGQDAPPTDDGLRDVVPAGAGDGDCRRFASVQDKGTPAGDWYISGITCSADQFEFSVIREDDGRNVAAADSGEARTGRSRGRCFDPSRAALRD